MLKIKRQWLLQSYASGFLFSYIVDNQNMFVGQTVTHNNFPDLVT